MALVTTDVSEEHIATIIMGEESQNWKQLFLRRVLQLLVTCNVFIAR
jgi:hypothetical protein